MAFLSARQIETNPILRRLISRPLPTRSRVQRRSASSVQRSPFALPAPVEREVAVSTSAGILIAGGLDAAQQSTSGVYLFKPRTGGLRRLGNVPQPFHDAAGALIAQRLFVFGGGAATSSSAVQAFDLRTGRGSVVAHLPRPLSDVSAATIGRTIYLVGGYDGTRPRPEIYRTRDGTHFVLAARLPVGLRYPAVGATDGDLFIAGGVSASGTRSTVYRFDPRTGHVSAIGRLPVASAHAVAVTVGSSVDVLGGSPQVSARIDGITGTVGPMRPGLDGANGAVADGRPSYVLGGDVGGTMVGRSG